MWPYVGDAARLSLWWCPPPTVHIQFDPYVGSSYEERYRDSTYAYELSGSVVGYEPPHRLAIQRLTGGRFGPTDLVEITLLAGDDGARVNLTHSFGPLTEEQRHQAHDFFADGWSDSLGNLQRLISDDSESP